MGNETISSNETKEHKHIKSLEEAYAYKAIDNIAQRFPQLLKKVQFIKRKENFSGVFTSVQQCPVYFLKNLRCLYQGQWQNGLPHGCGIAIYQNESYYQGEFNQGQSETQEGFFYFNNAPDKIQEEGSKNGSTIKKNKMKVQQNEKQKQIIDNKSSYYIGQFVQSKFHGKGKIYHKGIYYNGQWVNGKRQGQGKQYDQSSYNFEGKFINGLKSQYGVYTRKLNNRIYLYEGQFKYGKFNGNGKISIDNHQYYAGNFVNGKAQGKGQLNFKQGILKGQFKDNLVNGQGQFTFLQEEISKKQGFFHEKIIKQQKQPLRILYYGDEELTKEQYILYPIILPQN